jgi:hypothetical protein
MPKILQTAGFKTEKEEAEWWANNEALLVKELNGSAKDGTLGRGTLARRGLTPTNPSDRTLPT